MKRDLTRRGIAASVYFALTFLGVILVAGPAAAQPRIVTVTDESKHAGEFVVPINKSQILQLDVPFADLLVGNAEIADVLALTDRSIYVLGKTVGSTSLTIYGRNKTLIAVLDLIVSYDIEALKARLFELMPDERIEIRPLNTGIALSGTLSSATRMKRALTIAEQYAGAEGGVTNLMSVRGSQQVMLSIRFSEMSRAVAKNIDFSTAILGNDFALVTGLTGFPLSTLLTGASGPLGSVVPPLEAVAGADGRGFASAIGTQSLGSSTSLSVAFDALEAKGVVKTLAEPTLVALSGDTADFLAGGEFPIPVAQDDNTISVEFKEFGVALAFTPTVLDDGLINLAISVEESNIDTRPNAPDISVQGGIETPSLVTRRANTTIELHDGQSFAIAGLLQDDFADTVEQVPWIGDLPILGTLFRSSAYRRGETELVILATPRLVKPTPAGSLASPTDNFVPPSDVEFFLFGRMEAPESGIGPLGAGAGGIDGSYGHIIK
jgi:pilus assembly protein CpaC